MQKKNEKIPKQTLLGGEVHNLAYITPMESQVLRSMCGGVTPSGGQMMSCGVPAYQGGATQFIEAAQRRAKEEAIKQALRDQTTAFNRQANYADNPAGNIILDRYKDGNIRFKTPTGQTIQVGAFTGVNSGIPINMPRIQTIKGRGQTGEINRYTVTEYDKV